MVAQGGAQVINMAMPGLEGQATPPLEVTKISISKKSCLGLPVNNQVTSAPAALSLGAMARARVIWPLPVPWTP
jgi:hypothetical protein